MITTPNVSGEPGQAPLEELSRATREQFADASGFVSANLHLAIDRRHVVNYAQWRRREDYEAATQDPATREHMARAGALAEAYDPIYYTLRDTFGV